MFVRVCLKNTADADDRIRIDLNVGLNMLPVPGIVYFGLWGPLDENGNSSGILLRSDSVIDLGGGYDLNDRFHKTNLHARRMEVGQYTTMWVKWGTDEQEHTYVIEAVMQLSAVTDVVLIADVTSSGIKTLEQLPIFRARVRKSFNIAGYDDTVYRPPIGVEGDVAYLQGCYVFSPDNAIAKDGKTITAIVDASNLELIVDKSDVAFYAGSDE
jgi:hypothetical protein